MKIISENLLAMLISQMVRTSTLTFQLSMVFRQLQMKFVISLNGKAHLPFGGHTSWHMQQFLILTASVPKHVASHKGSF